MTGFIKLRSDQNKTHVQYGFESAKIGPGKNQTGTCINWFFIDPPCKDDYALITMVPFKSFVWIIFPCFVYWNCLFLFFISDYSVKVTCAYSFYVGKNDLLIFHFLFRLKFQG